MYFSQCSLKKPQMVIIAYYILPLASLPLLSVIKFNILHLLLLLLVSSTGQRFKYFFPSMCELSADLSTDL